MLLQRQACVTCRAGTASPAPILLMVGRRGLLLLTIEQKDLTMSPRLLQHLQHNRTGNGPFRAGNGSEENKGESLMGNLDV